MRRMKRSSTKPVEMADNNVKACVFMYIILQRLSLLSPPLMRSSEVHEKGSLHSARVPLLESR